ncbi:hypothetical protein EDD22DRAFT_465747 [Suillus occidentalis]|nr:hypothetical protein EDD22DRAFT_465747 [Suillus occidentalis]
MHQQPAQTGQWPIPDPPQHAQNPYLYPPMSQFPLVPSHAGPYPPNPHAHFYNQSAHAAHPVYGVHPPQHWGGYPPASQGTGVPLAPAQLPYPSVPYPVHPPQHWGGYPPAPQGVGVPSAPAQLSYPYAPPSAQPVYNYHQAQGLEQQAPAQPPHPATYPWLQNHHQHTQQGLWQQPPVVAAEESAVKRGKRKAVDSNDAPPSKRQAIEPRVDDLNIIPINGSISRGGSLNMGGSSSQTQEEAAAQEPCEDYDWASSGLLEEPVNSLDQAELAWTEQGNEFFDIIPKAVDVALGELEVVNSAEETDNLASDNLWEGFNNSVDPVLCWLSQESINSPDETADLAPDDLMNSFVKAEDPELVGKLMRKLIYQWFP